MKGKWLIPILQNSQISGGFAAGDLQPNLPLFRPEALAAASEPIGRPIAVLPIAWGVIVYTLLAMVVAFAVFLSVGTYTRKAAATGIVRAVGGEISIEAPSAGVVSRVLVVDGQKVRAGDTLVVADTPRNDLDGRPLSTTLIASLDREEASLNARLEALSSATAIERSGTAQRLLALEGELAAAVAQEKSAAERLALANDVYDRLQPAATKGFISAETMRRRREEVILLGQAMSDARGVQARLSGQLAELRSFYARSPLTLAQQRGQLEDALGRIRRERQGYASQRGFTIKAPANGTISALQVSEGQNVNPERSLMTLARSGVPTSAEIFVPSRAIGFLEPGQTVKVRYDAFPYQRFGVATGKIVTISSTVLRPAEVQAAVKVEEPVYRVLIELGADRISAYGKQYRIRPGLAFEASIILEERTFADWLLDPIIALRGRL